MSEVAARLEDLSRSLRSPILGNYVILLLIDDNLKTNCELRFHISCVLFFLLCLTNNIICLLARKQKRGDAKKPAGI